MAVRTACEGERRTCRSPLANKEKALAGEDFVYVRLSKRGQDMAGQHTLSIASGRHRFEFSGNKAQRVTRAFDWLEVLAVQHSNGEPLFEITVVKPEKQEKQS